jgi:hypothetical protein
MVVIPEPGELKIRLSQQNRPISALHEGQQWVDECLSPPAAMGSGSSRCIDEIWSILECCSYLPSFIAAPTTARATDGAGLSGIF